MNDTYPGPNDDRTTCPNSQEIRTYRNGEVVIGEGRECPCFFVLLSGQVRISQWGKRIRLLEDHDVFGLEGLFFRKPIPYSAKAVSKSRIAAYGPYALDYIMRESPRIAKGVLSSVLQQLVQTTRNFSEDTQSLALEDVRVVFFTDGQTIIEEGTTGTDFYRLVSSQGGLSVSVGGKEISRIDKPGDFFGAMAGLLGVPRWATVKSIGDTVVETYCVDDMDIIIRDFPELALLMMRTLVSRLKGANHNITGNYF